MSAASRNLRVDTVIAERDLSSFPDDLSVADDNGLRLLFNEWIDKDRARREEEISSSPRHGLGSVLGQNSSESEFDSPYESFVSTSSASPKGKGSTMPGRRRRRSSHKTGRKSSLLQVTMHGNPVALAAHRERGESGEMEFVVLSCLVTKVNRKGKKQQRALVVSDRAVYNFKPPKTIFDAGDGTLSNATFYGKWFKKHCQRRIEAESIASVLSSTDESERFVIQVREQYDYEFSSPKREDIVDAINLAHKRIVGTSVNRVSLSLTQMHAVMTTKPMWRDKVGSALVSKITGRKQTRVRAASARFNRIISGSFAAPFGTPREEYSPTDELSRTWTHDTGKGDRISGGSASSSGSRIGQARRPASMRIAARSTTSVAEKRKSNSTLGLSRAGMRNNNPILQSHVGRKVSTASSVGSIPEGDEPPPPPPPLPSFSASGSEAHADDESGSSSRADAANALLARMKNLNSGSLNKSGLTEKERKEREMHGDVCRLWNHFDSQTVLRQLRDKFVSVDPKTPGATIRGLAVIIFDSEGVETLANLQHQLNMLNLEHRRASDAGVLSILDELDCLMSSIDPQVRRWAMKSLWRLLPVWLAHGLIPFNAQGQIGDFDFAGSTWRDALTHSVSFPGNMEAGELYTMTVFPREYKSGDDALAQLSQGSKVSMKGRAAVIHGRRIFTHRCLHRLHLAAERALEESWNDDARLGLSDYSTLMELVLNVATRPSEKDLKKIETFGKTIHSPEALPAAMGCALMSGTIELMRDMMKDLNVLVMRSDANIGHILSLNQWQTLCLPALRVLPFKKDARSEVHNECLKYAFNFYAMVMAHSFKKPGGRFPFDALVDSTLLQIAVHSGWSERSVGVFRSILGGILGKAAVSTRVWKHDLDAEEWTASFTLIKLVEKFLFYRPIIMEDQTGSEALEVGDILDSNAEDPAEAQAAKRITRRSVSGEDAMLSIWERPYKTLISPFSNAVGRNPRRRDLYERRIMGASANIGVHMDTDGKCADMSLVNGVLHLLSSCGLRGEAGEENVDPTATKKQKSKLKYGSEIVKGFKTIKAMFESINDNTGGDRARDKAIKRVMKYLNTKNESQMGVGYLTSRTRQKATMQKLKTALVQQEAARIIRRTAIATMKTAILSRQILVIGEDEDDIVVEAEENTAPGPTIDWSNLCRSCALPFDVPEICVEAHDFKWHGTCMQCTEPECGDRLDPGTSYVKPGSGGGQLLCKRHMISNCGNTICPGCMVLFKKGDSALVHNNLRWHPEHFRCCSCNDRIGLPGTPKVKFTHSPVDGMPMCIPCYNMEYQCCGGCGRPVEEKEAIEALGKLWHVDHFVCMEGGCSLTDGINTSFYLDDNKRVLCQKHYEELMLPACGACGELVRDADGITFGDDSTVFHSRCFNCKKCNRSLVSMLKSTLERESDGKRIRKRASSLECGIFDDMGSPYCGDCFFDDFGQKCEACDEIIRGEAMQPGVEGDVHYHPHCFKCVECDRCLGDGESFFMVGKGDTKETTKRMLYCEDDYMRIFRQPCPGCGKAIEEAGSGELRWSVLEDGSGAKQYLDTISGIVQDVEPEHLDEPKAGFSVILFDQRWHSRCLVCTADGCNKSLFGGATTAHKGDDGRFYCREHWEAMYAKKCFECGEAVNEMVVKAFGNVWHPKCFKCSDPECGKTFGEADSVVGVEGRPYCSNHRPLAKCGGCSGPIFKRQIDAGEIVPVSGGHYHRACIACSICAKKFGKDDKVLVKDGALFCREDFLDKFAEKCDGTCGKPFDGCSILRIGNFKYHPECVTCWSCDKKLLDAETGKVRAFAGADGRPRCAACS